MKKRSEQKASFTRRATAGASAASAARICGALDNGWILLQGWGSAESLQPMVATEFPGRGGPRGTGSVRLAVSAVCEIAQHNRIGSALELLLHFGSLQRSVLAQGLTEFFAHFRIAVHYLHVEPEEMAHLVERRFKHLNGFHLRRIGQGFHKLGVRRSLHRGAIEFALNHSQVVGNSQNAKMNLFHAFPVLAIHKVLSVPPTGARSMCPNQDRILQQDRKGSPCA